MPQKIRRRSFLRSTSVFTLGLGTSHELFNTLSIRENTKYATGDPGKDASRVSCMLRRVLCPWKVAEIVDETVEWCVSQQVDEIMWITESSGMYKELLPLPEIRKILESLRFAKECTRGITIYTAGEHDLQRHCTPAGR